MLELAAGRLPPERVDRFECKALPGCTVESRQAEHKLQRESMEEDNIIIR